jgi:hypothetical protein
MPGRADSGLDECLPWQTDRTLNAVDAVPPPHARNRTHLNCRWLQRVSANRGAGRPSPKFRRTRTLDAAPERGVAPPWPDEWNVANAIVSGRTYTPMNAIVSD